MAARLYHAPSTDGSTILSMSKVDPTGQGRVHPPTTHTLSRTVTSVAATHLGTALARAQGSISSLTRAITQGNTRFESFMDEIAFTGTPISPRKRAHTEPPHDRDSPQSRWSARERGKKQRRGTPVENQNMVSPNEFWGRLSSAGDVTGFFAVEVSVPEKSDAVPTSPARLTGTGTGTSFPTCSQASSFFDPGAGAQGPPQFIEGAIPRAVLEAPKRHRRNASFHRATASKNAAEAHGGVAGRGRPEATSETYRAVIYDPPLP